MPVRYSQQFLAQLVDAAAYLAPRRLDRCKDHTALGLELRAQRVIGDVHGAFRDVVLGVRSPILIPRLGRCEHGLGCSRGIEIRFGDQLVLAAGCLNVLDRPGQSAVHDVGVEAFTLGPCGDRFPDLFPQLPFLRRSTPGFPEEFHQLAGGAHPNRSERSAQGTDRDGCQRVHQLGPLHHRHELRPPSSTPVEPVPVSRPTRRPRQRSFPADGAADHLCPFLYLGCPRGRPFGGCLKPIHRTPDTAGILAPGPLRPQPSCAVQHKPHTECGVSECHGSPTDHETPLSRSDRGCDYAVKLTQGRIQCTSDKA